MSIKLADGRYVYWTWCVVDETSAGPVIVSRHKCWTAADRRIAREGRPLVRWPYERWLRHEGVRLAGDPPPAVVVPITARRDGLLLAAAELRAEAAVLIERAELIERRAAAHT